MLRVLVAEDNYFMREGITTAISLDEGLELVATCESEDEVMTAIAATAPHVVVTDIRMPPSQTDEGIRIAGRLRDSHPGMGVVVLSQHVEPAYAVPLFERGSAGRAYLLKERVGDRTELSDAIRRVAEGGTVVDPEVVEALMGKRADGATPLIGRLTEREREVLAVMATGASNAAIGEALYISPRSVEKHVSVIFTKLDLIQSDETHRRVQAVLLYLGASA